MQELIQLNEKDVLDMGEVIVVRTFDKNTRKGNTFSIADAKYVNMVRKYMSLRPIKTSTDRFFLQFRKGRCSDAYLGQHFFSRVPSKVAAFLKLSDPKDYTGHSYRRTSASLSTTNERVNVISVVNIEPDT